MATAILSYCASAQNTFLSPIFTLAAWSCHFSVATRQHTAPYKPSISQDVCCWVWGFVMYVNKVKSGSQKRKIS